MFHNRYKISFDTNIKTDAHASDQMIENSLLFQDSNFEDYGKRIYMSNNP